MPFMIRTRNLPALHSLPDLNPAPDEVFGAEFLQRTKNPSSSQKVAKTISPEERERIMRGFSNVRSTVLGDSLFVGLLGFSATWACGRFEDAASFGIGSFLGVLYSVLLGRYVETLGTGERSKASENARFIPAVILIALYGKFRTFVSIIPELAGFFVTYQLATFLQIFNKDLYGEGGYDENE
eukprot:CAMPEP_0174968992 /NCGR_PEP_ID=MMETSP0004_2-20121128/8473_1 /TAXON_ID=420556 /ORGANISM="Ochromonas sp., Strain CCMP1393" /LENGTH=182 /DNA_ID=CAMNT_0016218349 /DNA_START=181 /DNA_END=729 /DNA_ORIENTATION=-